MRLLDKVRRWIHPGAITVEDGQRVMRLPWLTVWRGARLNARIIRYPHLWRWWPHVSSASGTYDDGRPFTCGHISLFDAQLEWDRSEPVQRKWRAYGRPR